MQDNRVYVRTYFRINTPSYRRGRQLGFENEEDRRTFYIEAVSILKTLGFTTSSAVESERHGACPTLTRGVEELYCHPQELSGYIAEDAIAGIEDAFKCARTFRHYNTDHYETALNYTLDEFTQALEESRTHIIECILNRFRTKRRNLYMPDYALQGVRSGLPTMKSGVRVGGVDAKYKLDAIEAKYINGVFDDLVANGDILKAEKGNGKYYRTRTPRDPKLYRVRVGDVFVTSVGLDGDTVTHAELDTSMVHGRYLTFVLDTANLVAAYTGGTVETVATV